MSRRLGRTFALAGCLVGTALGVSGGPVVSARDRPLSADSSASESRLRPAYQPLGYADGLARPRALAFSPREGLLYVALSTADAVAVVEPGPRPRVRALVPVCGFPQALAALPEGGVLVACRDQPALLRLVQRDPGTWVSSALSPLPTSGARGLALSGDGAFVYLASPAARGLYVLALADGRLLQTLPTGLGPRTLELVAAETLVGQPRPLLLVSNFVSHTVTVHEVLSDGLLSPARQTIATEAPVLGLALHPKRRELWLLTHEDRPLSRANGPVEGLDSGILRLPFAAPRVAKQATKQATKDGVYFSDRAGGGRAFTNFSERRDAPVVELAAVATTEEGMAVVGAGTDNLWVETWAKGAGTPPSEASSGEDILAVGHHPVDVAALPGQRFVTADRLSDTLTFVAWGREGAPARVEATLSLSAAAVAPREAARPSEDWRRRVREGERLFFSTALVPHNVAEGPLSLYTCAACHDDARIDGRLHPAKKNRFFSMTKTCVGLASTPPFLSLGEPATLEAFADNIVGTHAQGAERDPAHFDEYPVDLVMRRDGLGDGPKNGPKDGAKDGAGGVAWQTRHLGPAEVRASLTAYMASIVPAPSPFVAPGKGALSAEERHGLTLFRDGCAGCHQLVGSTARANTLAPAERERRLLRGQVALTSPNLYDVGTPVLGKGGNNPPSLRGVWEAAPYFSDGSAGSLDDVLARTNPEAARVHAPENAAAPKYDERSRAALRAFLLTL